ncbi:glycosyltransferase family 4 protein [Arachidicoccus sp.]|uniref:glycosyltransferase family 4 protein n=1 Tax=Arachidicoccus sp. TaxID=1872624 RepID=UPI003D257C6C
MNKKTLIILTPAFPSSDASKEESIWVPAKQRLIKCINRLYPDIEIIILSFQFPLSKKEYNWNRNIVIPFAGGNKHNWQNKLTWLNVFNKLRKLQSKKNIIGLLSFWYAECAFVGHYFSKLYHLKHVCWISGQDAKGSNIFARRIRSAAEELAAMSDFLMNEFEKNHHIRPAHLIPNAIDVCQFKLKKYARSIDIIGIGGLSPLKQYDVYIEVISKLRSDFPNIDAYLCGDGEEREKLEVQIERLELEDNITLTGKISQDEVFELLQQSRILLHTSNFEGFGNVCIEALYAGAHVISFIQPMQQDIPHWHIVNSKEEMIQKALSLLYDKSLKNDSVLPFNMNDSAEKFMHLFLGQK